MDLNLVLAGEAGQGLKTLEALVGKALFRAGFNIFSSKDYMSRVRGGHNFMSIRFGSEKIQAPRQEIDILLALNDESIEKHQAKVSEDGFILYDGEVDDSRFININASELAKKINLKAKNSVYAGAVWKLLDLPITILQDLIGAKFSDEDIISDNEQLLEAGYNAIDDGIQINYNKSFLNDRNGKEIYINGNQAMGLGATAAGVKFYSAYPMTPSTGILNFLAQNQKEFGIVVEQAEDEIGAINMALGASYSGVRAMTGSSGGGFSLMVEALGYAGVGEIPLVVAEVQRPGPATGLPTRTGQGDLLFAINASQDEFPLIVLAPGDQEEAFYQTFRAFNLADKYHLPVIILSDQFLADSSKNISRYNIEELEVDRNFIDKEKVGPDKYKRYLFTDDGISPRAYPGQLEDDVVLVDSHEHDENGFVTEDIELRNKMMAKRFRKLDKYIAEDRKEPEYIGPEEPDKLIICWGSTSGPMKEALNTIKEKDDKIGLLLFKDIWPLPDSKLKSLASTAEKIISVEANYSGQLAKLIQQETAIKIDHKILKYDGRPFTAKEIADRYLNEVINHG
ncbi:MAG: 2-oxoacid:acceptor oxidoreductase subunit alpha [Bacillota bacterium]